MAGVRLLDEHRRAVVAHAGDALGEHVDAVLDALEGRQEVGGHPAPVGARLGAERIEAAEHVGQRVRLALLGIGNLLRDALQQTAQVVGAASRTGVVGAGSVCSAVAVGLATRLIGHNIPHHHSQ